MSSDSIPEHQSTKIEFDLVRGKRDERLTHPLKRRYF